MEQHILHLLREHPIVMVPSLGAFVGTLRESRYNINTHVFEPPTKVISFSGLNKTYDLTLANYICQATGCDILDAGRQIEQFAANVKHELHVSGQYNLDGIGYLYLDAGGDIRLNALHAISHSDVFGLPEIHIAPLENELAAPKYLDAEPKPMMPEVAGTLANINEQLPGASLGSMNKLRPLATAALTIAFACMLGVAFDKLANSSDTSNNYGPNVNVSPRATETNYSPAEGDVPPTDNERGNVNAEGDEVVVEEYLGTDNRSKATIEAPAPKPVEMTKPIVAEPAVKAKTAVYIIGSFGQMSNVKKASASIKKLGQDVYTDRKAGLTRVGAVISYSNQNELEEELAFLKKSFGNAIRIR